MRINGKYDSSFPTSPRFSGRNLHLRASFNHRNYADRLFEMYADALVDKWRARNVVREPVMQGGKIFCFIPYLKLGLPSLPVISELGQCVAVEKRFGSVFHDALEKIDRRLNPNEEGYYSLFYHFQGLFSVENGMNFLEGFALGAMLSRLTNRSRQFQRKEEQRETSDLQSVLQKWVREKIDEHHLPGFFPGKPANVQTIDDAQD